MKPSISIIIPHHDDNLNLNKCISAILRQKLTGIEIIIVDDCSKKKPLFDQKNISVISLKKRSGPAHARNIGVKKSRTENILFLDSDVLLGKNMLDLMENAIDKNPDCIIQGVYTRAGTKGIFSSYKETYSLHKFSSAPKSGLRSASTFCLGMKKSTFSKAGGFDEAYSYKKRAEDVDFGMRASQKSIDILLERKIMVAHMKKYSFFGLLLSEHKKIKAMSKIFFRYKNKSKLSDFPVSKSPMKKRYELIASALVAPLFLLSLPIFLISPLLLSAPVLLLLLFAYLNRHLLERSINKPADLFIHMSVMIIASVSLLVAGAEYLIGDVY